MKETPLVSVLIPAYNCEAYVARAITSVLSQTFQDFECIVIDDGSTDRTREEIESFGERVTCVVQQNAGAAAARNKGIAMARGKYLAFLDADDYWMPPKLEFQLRVFDKYPEVVLVSTDRRFHDDGRDAVGESAGSLNFDWAAVKVHCEFDHLFANPYLGTPSVMVKTDIVRAVGGFDHGFSTAEDVDLWYRCCWGNAYARIALPLTYVHRLDGSLGSHIRSYQDNLSVVERFLEVHPEFRDSRRTLVSALRQQIFRNWILSLLYRGDGDDAREVLRRSRREGRLDGYEWLWLKSYVCGPLAAIRGRR